MTTITWDFNSGAQGWVFEDQSTGTNSSTGVYSLAKQGWEFSLTTGDPGGDAWAAIIKEGLNIPVEIGDTVEFDHSAPSDAPSASSRNIYVTYDDETEDFYFGDSGAAGTLTANLVTAGTIVKLRVRLGRIGALPSYTQDITEVRVNATATVTATPGKLRTPFNFIGEFGSPASGGADKIASISADGLSIYIAAFNDLGFPTLVKIAAALNADGSVVFNPGGGGRIGVQCADLNASIVYVAGSFDGTNTVEKSTDAGASFSVIDDATFGAIRSFAVGPNNDNRILLFDGDNGDIIESVNGGSSWTTVNAAVTQLINSIARFDINPEEIVIGNQGGASNSINYSPNTGVDLEDYQVAPYPNANATKVIAN